jgi:probable phosphoglycerate mutase
LDMPLCEQGREEVAEISAQLRDKQLEVIYAPASQPAEETARLLAETLDVKFRKITHLESLNVGLWQGMLIEEVQRKQPRVYRQWQEQPETVCPPEGEMLNEVDERVRAALTKLLKRHGEGTIGLVLPEPLLSLARRFLTQEELGDLWRPAEGRPRWELLTVRPEIIFASSS